MRKVGEQSFYRGGDRILGGVCSGLAAGFHVDSLWVRIAFVLLAMAAGRVGATRASAAAFLMPPVSLLLGILVRSEHVALVSILGSAICVTGAWMIRPRATVQPEPPRTDLMACAEGTAP